MLPASPIQADTAWSCSRTAFTLWLCGAVRSGAGWRLVSFSVGSRRAAHPSSRILAAVAQITDHLLHIPLFAGCSARDLDRLARATDEVTLDAGTTLTRQGDIGREAFVLLSGTAEVQRDGVSVAEVGPGAVIGELALLDGGPRTATVIATTEVDVIVLSRPAFNAVLDEIPTLAHQLLVTLAHRLRAADDLADLN